MKFKQIELLPEGERNHFSIFALNEVGEIWIYVTGKGLWTKQRSPSEEEIKACDDIV